MMNPPPRIPALSSGEFTAEQATLVGDWAHLNFSRVIVQHPGLYRVFIPMIDMLIRGSSLPPRDREILVFRTLELCHEVYENHHHVLIARNAGMSDAEIEDAKAGDGSLSPFDCVLVKAAEELVTGQRVSDETWDRLGERYSQSQKMEAVALVGCYTLMAMATKSYGIQVEDDPDDFRRLAQLRQYK
jgi:alkylhydroperoxidase family enzyme